LNSFVNTVYIIAGPTAVGKTRIAIDLAKRLHTSIISADSRQCYQEMSIGTAKPTQQELQEVHHYFIDEFSVTQSLTAADYEKLSLGYLEGIFKTNSAAVVCGGTGMYIQALCNGLDEMPETDKEIAEGIDRQYKEKGMEWLQQTIKKEDPVFYEKGEIQNPARMMRALIFMRSTGESIINYRTGVKKQRPFTIIKIGLELSRDILYERINKRVDMMVQEGLLDEVKRLYPLKQLKNLQTVGYSELFEYMDGKYSLEDALLKIKQHTRNYAKRQMTWFKNDKQTTWLRADDEKIVDKILLSK
jgi:tRNA dimethylallyltransferase